MFSEKETDLFVDVHVCVSIQAKWFVGVASTKFFHWI